MCAAQPTARATQGYDSGVIRLPLHRNGAAPETYELAPSKILGIGRNYHAHAAEMGAEVPAEPLIFLKAPTSLLAPGGCIIRPANWERVDHEGELGVIIGRRARHVTAEHALEHVLGYTCVNDVTVRAMQKRDGQWWRAKGMDTFCPVGPRIVCDLDASDLRVQTRVNGDVRQDARTSAMIFSVAELIAYISRHMTLEPGDLITTGTPEGVGDMPAGARVTIEVEGIGVLENTVSAES
jgi:2-keto-4-pentenoate hydratase/2-oxohepta-3-ene-1,7-dioic acid hydratase in catechol pathway